METEIYRDVVGYEGLYTVSNCGSVMSFNNGGRGGRRVPKLLKNRLNQTGYYAVLLGNGINEKQGRTGLVHRLVAKAFIPNPLNLAEVNHKNGNRADNRVENLEWLSKADNMKHSYNVLGRVKPGRGEKSLHAILSVETVKKIKERLKTPSLTFMQIGREFGCSGTHVSRIAKGKCWEMIHA